jgi:hypothetical protein
MMTQIAGELRSTIDPLNFLSPFEGVVAGNDAQADEGLATLGVLSF